MTGDVVLVGMVAVVASAAGLGYAAASGYGTQVIKTLGVSVLMGGSAVAGAFGIFVWAMSGRR